MKPNHHLDFVRIKLITEKRLYSEEELTSSQKVVQFISKELAECDREVLCILNCNAKCQVINMNVVSMGSLTETLVTGRELFKSAILSNARGVILIHNHPSGNFTPSKEDFLVTTKMCIGGDILGIDVWDHIIIAGGSGERYSMAEQGKMQEFRMLWSSIFVTLMANKIGGLQFGIYRNCQISSRVFHTAVAALPLTKANRSDFE